MGKLEDAFGQELRELRIQRGLSQEALSFRAGRHRTYVSLVERGRSSPTLATLQSLAEALDVPISELIQRVERHLGTAKRRRAR